MKKFIKVISRYFILLTILLFVTHSNAISAEREDDPFPPRFMLKLGGLVTSAENNNFGDNAAVAASYLTNFWGTEFPLLEFEVGSTLGSTLSKLEWSDRWAGIYLSILFFKIGFVVDYIEVEDASYRKENFAFGFSLPFGRFIWPEITVRTGTPLPGDTEIAFFSLNYWF